MTARSERARKASAPKRAVSGSCVPSFLRSDVLDQSSFLFLFNAALVSGTWNTSLEPGKCGSKRPGKQFRKAFDDVRAVQLLTSGALRNDSQHAFLINSRCQLFHYDAFVAIRQRSRSLYVKRQCDAAADLVDILAAGPATSLSGEPQLVFRDRD